MRRPRGAVLLLVLWLVMLLAALVGAFALTARTEHLQGQVLARGLEARAAARAGIEYAVVRAGLPDQRLRWAADGSEHPWRFGDAEVAVRIVDEQGKVDLNMAGAGLISSLLQQLGVDDRASMQLAGAILEWRDAEPMRSIAEVEQVPGMTPALYARLAPLVTVYSGLAMPDPAAAPARVRAAMGVGGTPSPLVAGNSGTYSVESRASIRGRTAVLRVVVRSGGNGLPGSAWTALRWEEGASPR